MTRLKSLALVPARGGSKRLPRKNIMDFLGKPIIAYTIEAALETGLFDRVVVSTEDAEIARVSETFGALISERPSNLASDTSTVAEVCLNLLEKERAEGRVYDVLCCLYATAPLRTAEDIAATMMLIAPGRCDFAISVTPYTHYAHQALRCDDLGCLEPMWPDLVFSTTDQIGQLVAGNGSTYAASVPAFIKSRTFYGPGMRGHVMPIMRSVDIDNREDFEMACCFAQKLGLMERANDHQAARGIRP